MNLETAKIPVTLGFANFGGHEFDRLQSEDVAILSPLFENTNVAPNGSVPCTKVLFVYAHVNDDGTFQGLNSAGVRQVVQGTEAVILVVASPNPAEKIQKAIALPGPKTANLVFTLDRNGRGFGSFFRTLFEKMGAGEEMLSAWVKLNPQGPVGDPSNPATLLFVEAGGIAFPVASRTTCKLRFVRQRQWRDRLRSYEIFVSGSSVGMISNGSAFEVEVPSVRMLIQAKVDWCRSAPSTIDATPGQIIEIEISNRWPHFSSLWAVTFGAGNYLTLQSRLVQQDYPHT